MRHNEKSIEFANLVSDKVQEQYKRFLIISGLHDIGCTDDEKLINSYNEFKKCVDNCTVINHELIYFN